MSDRLSGQQGIERRRRCVAFDARGASDRLDLILVVFLLFVNSKDICLGESDRNLFKCYKQIRPLAD